MGQCLSVDGGRKLSQEVGTEDELCEVGEAWELGDNCDLVREGRREGRSDSVRIGVYGNGRKEGKESK